ncbi:DUF3426 domain-containing protein [Acidovorax sp.]|uniref:DUF3426 domain-containing protein n=1 Tax=Acidovorax sp. TaxID=1872122 RepID=UPI0031D883B5
MTTSAASLRASSSVHDTGGALLGNAVAMQSGLGTSAAAQEAEGLAGKSGLPLSALPTLAGYELPAAEPVESEVSTGVAFADEAHSGIDLASEPALPLSEQHAFAPLAGAPVVVPVQAQQSDPKLVDDPASQAAPLPSVDFVSKPDLTKSVEMELVKDDSPAAVLQARSKRAVDDEDSEADESDSEVSFVVAARRKAFWRKPVVRMALVLAFVILLLGLTLQIVLQERDHLAALDARARPWLVKLCEPLRCELAPVRQIANVVIDSSSFNKARGDSYQLALTMKSTATIPLAMPAVELTLTDAQDQPVVRRVLLPNDMAAPSELPAQGEWGTSVSVLVTTGGARVAGYRLLAFYP